MYIPLLFPIALSILFGITAYMLQGLATLYLPIQYIHDAIMIGWLFIVLSIIPNMLLFPLLVKWAKKNTDDAEKFVLACFYILTFFIIGQDQVGDDVQLRHQEAVKYEKERKMEVNHEPRIKDDQQQKEDNRSQH